MATTAPSSNPHNPFRTPNLTPQHTQTSAAPEPQPVQSSLAEVITEDAPPAYTPTADPYQGEAAVEFGPRRPWQQAPPPVMSPQATGSMSMMGSSSTHSRGENEIAVDGDGWQRYPGVVTTSPPPQSLSGVFAPPPGRPPPPRHPSSPSVTTTSSYAPPPGRPPPPRHPSQSRPRSTPPHDEQPQYAPPPGQPPRRAVSSASNSRTGPGNGGVPDDGRPTTTPTPGHPLLRDGKMLVYPASYECAKCSNTGYKSNDPSHPCRKCWDKYAKPYAGALAYAPFPSSSSPSSPTHTRSGSAGAAGNFQRPLPKFRPPQASASSERPRSMAGGYPGALHRDQTQTQQRPRPRSPAQPSFSHSRSSFLSPHPPPQPPFQHSRSHTSATPTPNVQIGVPPPGAMVLPPGDPRIGGRLCWRCTGRGSVSFMIFDEEVCGVCGGVGRVFN